MRIKVDWEADVLYVLFDEEAELEVAEEVGDEVVLDLDADGRIVGLEVLNLSSKCGKTSGLSSLEIREEPIGRRVG